MKKKVPIIAVILLLLLGGGYVFMKSRVVNKDVDSGMVEKSNVFTSIKDAMSKNVTLICEFKDQTGASTKSYIKNGAVRISSAGSTNENQAGEIVMKDKKMYMWDLKTKQGFVYEIPDSENNQIGATATEINQSENYLNMIETYKDSCKVTSVEDSYFDLPEDVKFQDMSKLLEDLKNQMPQIPQQ